MTATEQGNSDKMEGRQKTQLDKMFRLEIALILIYSQLKPVAEAINPPKLSQKTSNHHGHDHVMGTFLAS
jgi:hypothetical protein